jgi:hypothetical protein
MAKKATAKNSGKSGKKTGTAVARTTSGGGRSGKQDSFDAGDAFIKLMQSPLVAELVAVAATAALASLAEHGFSGGGGGSRGKRAGKAVKEAGKAAAAAVGRRIGTEFDEIRAASKAKAGAEA